MKMNDFLNGEYGALDYLRAVYQGRIIAEDKRIARLSKGVSNLANPRKLAPPINAFAVGGASLLPFELSKVLPR